MSRLGYINEAEGQMVCSSLGTAVEWKWIVKNIKINKKWIKIKMNSVLELVDMLPEICTVVHVLQENYQLVYWLQF